MTELNSIDENIEYAKEKERMNMSLDVNGIHLRSSSTSQGSNLSFISVGRRRPAIKPPPTSHRVSQSKSEHSGSLGAMESEAIKSTFSSLSKKRKGTVHKHNRKFSTGSFPIKTKNISVPGSFSSVTSLSEDSQRNKSSEESSKKSKNTENFDYVMGLFLGLFFNIFGVLILCCQRRRKKRIEGAVHGAVISGLVLVFMIHTICIHSFMNDSLQLSQSMKNKMDSIEKLNPKDLDVLKTSELDTRKDPDSNVVKSKDRINI